MGMLVRRDKVKRALFWDTACVVGLPAGACGRARVAVGLQALAFVARCLACPALALCLPSSICARRSEPYHYVRFDDWDEDHLLIITGAGPGGAAGLGGGSVPGRTALLAAPPARLWQAWLGHSRSGAPRRRWGGSQDWVAVAVRPLQPVCEGLPACFM